MRQGRPRGMVASPKQEPPMSTVSASRLASLPSATLWNVLRDFGGIARWNPGLKSSELINGSANQGVGACRRCVMVDGKNHVLERITAWQDTGSYTVEIYAGTMPLKTAFATLGVERVADGESRLSMNVEYTPKFGILGKILNALMLEKMLRKNCEDILEGLARHAALPS
jgi:hypothetical protein